MKWVSGLVIALYLSISPVARASQSDLDSFNDLAKKFASSTLGKIEEIPKDGSLSYGNCVDEYSWHDQARYQVESHLLGSLVPRLDPTLHASVAYNILYDPLAEDSGPPDFKSPPLYQLQARLTQLPSLELGETIKDSLGESSTLVRKLTLGKATFWTSYHHEVLYSSGGAFRTTSYCLFPQD